MNEKSRQKFKYLEKRKGLKVKQKAFFIIFVVLSVAKNCLRPESAPFNAFLVNVPILHPLKTPENLRFSGVFRGYEMGTLARNGLKTLIKLLNF